jgi:hypothetical protein
MALMTEPDERPGPRRLDEAALLAIVADHLHGEDTEDRDALYAELIEQRRLVIRLHADHLYGALLPMPG